MSTSALQTVPVEAIREQAEPWSLKAHELRVSDVSMVALAGEYLRDIKALRKEIAATCDPVIKQAHAAHKAATTMKRDLEAELVEADRIIAGKVAAWHDAKRREAQRLVAAAERQARATQESAEREAAALREAGELELAEQAAVEARRAPAPVVAQQAVSVEGVSTRTTHRARVVDLPTLLRAVLSGSVPLAAVQVNEKLLQQQARSLGEQLNWPGVEVQAETIVVRR
jgi:hypothetical protein